MESVMTGQSQPDAAAKNYDQAVEGIVGGKDSTTTKSTGQ
jgi:multiple sugar transport system substrate-binding protein